MPSYLVKFSFFKKAGERFLIFKIYFSNSCQYVVGLYDVVEKFISFPISLYQFVVLPQGGHLIRSSFKP